MRKSEWGKEKSECGLRPVGAYAPEGRWNAECGMRRGGGEVGMRNAASGLSEL